MNNQTAYWIWLQNALGYSNVKTSSVLENYTFAEDFYRASLEEKLLCGCFTKNDIPKLSNTSLTDAYRIINNCDINNIEIITIGDYNYPEQLKYLDDPPIVLYAKGNVGVLSDKLSVGIVGTRNATAYGRRTAFQFGYGLANSGFTVVSGGAVGIDTAAHKGVLNANGKTICVLGCGIEYNYLRENRGMREHITRKGVVVSEYPPDYPPSKYTFPRRNRIISGLSKGLIIVEAGMKSGSLITVNHALQQGKDVFAIPGDVQSSVSVGTNELIKDGAVPVTSYKDIVDYYVKITPYKVMHGGVDRYTVPDTIADAYYKVREKQIKIDTQKEKTEKHNKVKEPKKEVSALNEFFLWEETEVKKDTLPQNQTVAANEFLLKNETVSANESLPKNETVSANESLLKNETVSANESLPKNETLTANESLLKNETVSANESLPKNETLTANESLLKNETVTAKEALLKNNSVGKNKKTALKREYDQSNNDSHQTEGSHKKTSAVGNKSVKNCANNSLPLISQEDYEDLSDNAKTILRLLSGEPMHIDQMVLRSGLAVHAVHSAVTELEFANLIEFMDGRNYKILVSIK